MKSHFSSQHHYCTLPKWHFLSSMENNSAIQPFYLICLHFNVQARSVPSNRQSAGKRAENPGLRINFHFLLLPDTVVLTQMLSLWFWPLQNGDNGKCISERCEDSPIYKWEKRSRANASEMCALQSLTVKAALKMQRSLDGGCRVRDFCSERSTRVFTVQISHYSPTFAV